MKFVPITCPTCGEPANGTVDLVPGCALLTKPDEHGDVDWVGETEMFWDGQSTVEGPNGEYTLECTNGHQWLAVLADHIGR